MTPKILFVDSHVTYKGRQTSLKAKVSNIMNQLQTKPEVYVIQITQAATATDTAMDNPSLEDFVAKSTPSDKLVYERVPFNHPLFICYSSGTTGPPKCIAHQHGLLLQLRKVSMLHNSLGPEDVVMQYSSTSWVMFYVMNGHFSTGATMICYDGSPMWPDVRKLLRILERHR